MDLDTRLLSVVVPIYNEEETLPELASRLTGAAEPLGFDACEFLLVSDGSEDRSEAIIRDLVRTDDRFRGVFLSRNFGHQAAVSIGLEYSRGTIVGVIDGDLQDPPEILAHLITALEQGADVAYGIRRDRKEHWLKRGSYGLFYRLLRRVAPVKLPADAGDFCCLRRSVLDALLALPERKRFLRGLRAWVGFEQVGVEYSRHPRAAGVPKYSITKLFGLAFDGFFGLSTLPIRVIQVAGFFFSGLAVAVAFGYFSWSMIAPQQFPSGFASLIISIWFFAGVQLLCLGIIGEYVARTFDESRGRPTAIVREVVASDPKVRVQKRARQRLDRPRLKNRSKPYGFHEDAL